MAKAKPSQEVYQSLLMGKIQELVSQAPAEAKAALEMSQEHAPELYQIAQSQPQHQWAASLMNSDSMQSLTGRVDWNLPGELMQAQPEVSLRNLLEQMP
jgi:hypothetical protein